MSKVRQFVVWTCLATSSLTCVPSWAGDRFTLTTGDGLELRLAPDVRVRLNGRTLPATSSPGGLLVRDAARRPRPNLLSNPGFEQGMDGWTAEGKSSVETTTAHEGRACLRLGSQENEGQGKSCLTSQSIPVGAETDYVISFWARGTGLVHHDSAGHLLFDWSASIIQINEAGDEIAPRFQVSFPTVPALEFNWTLVRSSFRTHDSTCRIQVVWEVPKGKGDLWVDDVWLSEVGSGPEVQVGGRFLRSGDGFLQEGFAKSRFSGRFECGMGWEIFCRR